jgi:alpha-L-rhamnosidase
VIGRGGDARRYRDLAGRVRAAWQAEFIGPDGRLHPDTQANHVRALAFGLVPAELRVDAAARLVALIRAGGTQLATGFLATPQLLPVLADTGQLNVAYELLFTDTMPSWLYMIDRGATTVWERWDGVDADGVPFESLNHYSKGAVVTFLHRYVAGIRLLDGSPGYRHFRIESAWRLDAGTFELSVTVPPGTTAEVALPDGSLRMVASGRHTLRP